MSNGKSMFEQARDASMADQSVSEGEPRDFVRLGGRRAGKMLLHMSRVLVTDQGRALEAGVAAFLQAGVPLDGIEIVHETYSKHNDFETIHTRAFVRMRAK